MGKFKRLAFVAFALGITAAIWRRLSRQHRQPTEREPLEYEPEERQTADQSNEEQEPPPIP